MGIESNYLFRWCETREGGRERTREGCMCVHVRAVYVNVGKEIVVGAGAGVGVRDIWLCIDQGLDE